MGTRGTGSTVRVDEGTETSTLVGGKDDICDATRDVLLESR
jgi:hypothetical protein